MSNNFEANRLLEQAKKLATPIDFDALIAQGVLEKKGAWYKVPDWDKLPEHAEAKAYSIRTDGTDILVKFSKATKAAQKIVDKLSK